MKIKILSTLVIGSLLVAVAIGDTTSNGASLQTLVNQQRAKEEKNLETKKRPLETPEDFDVENIDTIKCLFCCKRRRTLL